MCRTQKEREQIKKHKTLNKLTCKLKTSKFWGLDLH